MFYESEEIDTQLVCMQCNEHFGVPKILPCGSTICVECEDKIWNYSDLDIMCPICKDNHQRPSTGFPINRIIQCLLKTKPHCAYDLELYKKSMETLDNITRDTSTLKDSLKLVSVDDKIRQHCDNLRQEVDNSIRDRKAQIDELRNFLTDKINDYEKSCLEGLKKEEPKERPQDKEEVEKLVEEADSKLSQWKNDLKRLDLDEDDIRNILNEAKDLDNKLVSRKRINDYFLFSGEPLAFHRSRIDLQPKHIGELYSMKPTNLNSERIKAAPSVRINYKDHSIICRSTITPVNTDRFAIAYLMYTHEPESDLFTYKIRLRLYYRPNGKLLNEVSELHNTQNINCLSIASLGHEIYLVFQDQNGDNWLRNYDPDLRLHRAVQLPYQPLSVHSCNKFLYVVSSQQPFIHVYDKDFKEIGYFGQNNDPNQPYFIKNCEKVQFQNELVFVYDDESNVYALLRDSGLLLKKIETNQSKCQFQVDPTLRIVLMDPKNKTFYIYDLNGDLIDEFDIKDIEKLSIFTVTKDGALAVSDNENGILHIY
jgi:hypothetical protein